VKRAGDYIVTEKDSYNFWLKGLENRQRKSQQQGRLAVGKLAGGTREQAACG
jgi:hypothetical protein